MDKRFDFSEIDKVLPTAEKMQKKDRMTDALENESAKLFDRLVAKDRVVISTVSFWCMIEVIIFLLAVLVCTCAANARFIHDVMLWKMLGYTVGFLIASIILTVLVCHKLKQ